MPRVEIREADIARLEVDAIVNAANDHLWMGSGVAGAIRRAGGEEIEREAVAKGPIRVGDAVTTGGGRLRARWVIHAAAMGQDLRTDERKIRDATRNALLRASEAGARSVALPALGTGVGGFPLERCAEVMVDEVVRHLSGPTTVVTVVFALRGADAVDVFTRALGGSDRQVR